MVPIYFKPNPAKRRRKRPGAVPGHPGKRREKPVKIDQREAHRLPCRPHCQAELQRCSRARSRVIEDIPEIIEPVVTEHVIQRDYCPRCKQHVEPVVPDAMPKADLGHNVVALSSWFHYGLGLMLEQIVDVLGYHLQTRITPGNAHRLTLEARRRVVNLYEAWGKPELAAGWGAKLPE